MILDESLENKYGEILNIITYLCWKFHIDPTPLRAVTVKSLKHLLTTTPFIKFLKTTYKDALYWLCAKFHYHILHSLEAINFSVSRELLYDAAGPHGDGKGFPATETFRDDLFVQPEAFLKLFCLIALFD